jgi:copper chaperone CopZ
MKTYRVQNVKCGGCANTLKEKLKDGFGAVEVDLEKMPREITINQDDIDEDKLSKLLKSIGYPLIDEDMNFVEDVEAKAKSFVSCAIGKMKE